MEHSSVSTSDVTNKDQVRSRLAEAKGKLKEMVGKAEQIVGETQALFGDARERFKKRKWNLTWRTENRPPRRIGIGVPAERESVRQYAGRACHPPLADERQDWPLETDTA
ncbi:CsbD family protein [Burkholderia diffusa]|uniref:CsbD family protein n=1 Tax=Burkholderia diffusa TaxID=488732 RepID=UPI003AF718B4